MATRREIEAVALVWTVWGVVVIISQNQVQHFFAIVTTAPRNQRYAPPIVLVLFLIAFYQFDYKPECLNYHNL
jgi:hypothetical protein